MSESKTSKTSLNTEPRVPQAGGCAIAIMIAAGILVGIVMGVIGAKYGFERLFAKHAATSSTPTATAPASSPTVRQLWTCGMHPQVIQDHPGECPICHMQLTPLKTDGASRDATTTQSGSGAASITIDPVIVQNMGVRIATVARQPLRRSIRMVGYLEEAQPNARDVNLQVSGWIRHLHANVEGMHVQQGDPLFDLYSPELQLAIEELISARRALHALPKEVDETSNRASQSLFDAASRKLELWGLPREQVTALAVLDRAPESITFVSPISGIVTEKPVTEGSAVKAGDRVLRIVDYSTLWLDAKVFESDLPLIAPGQAVKFTIASRPGESFDGTVASILPRIDADTRTATARLEVHDPELHLRPA